MGNCNFKAEQEKDSHVCKSIHLSVYKNRDLPNTWFARCKIKLIAKFKDVSRLS